MNVKLILSQVVQGGLVLASAVGLAPVAFSQGADTEPPVVSFSAGVLRGVKPGETIAVRLTATDNVGIRTVPRVACDRGFSNVGKILHGACSQLQRGHR
ncbi:MAG: hypothetical protein GDA39_01560 [Hyphomonadaceae bacterium]|nr:hypothetical protein [Hyphomonadaceae bacterium]